MTVTYSVTRLLGGGGVCVGGGSHMQKASLSPAFVPNSHRPPPREETPETSREFLPLGDIRGVLTGAFSVELAGGKFKPGVCPLQPSPGPAKSRTFVCGVGPFLCARGKKSRVGSW